MQAKKTFMQSFDTPRDMKGNISRTLLTTSQKQRICLMCNFNYLMPIEKTSC